jgi:hypothetical protein
MFSARGGETCGSAGGVLDGACSEGYGGMGRVCVALHDAHWSALYV